VTVNFESTFFTKPIRWDSGTVRGFIIRPHDDNGTVWGEPYEDEDGNPILPGTEGGPYANAFLGIKNGEWMIQRNRKWQSAGNIDWKGPWVDADAQKRTIITVNGPTQRYWNTGAFKYDEGDNKHYIYFNGHVCGIAPKPVLGACMKPHTFKEYNNILQVYEDKTYQSLIAIVKSGNSDVCIVRKAMANLLEEEITEEDFALYSRWHKDIDLSLEPDAQGWIALGDGIGYADGKPSVEPEAPWFFNTECTVARTMRRCAFSNTTNQTTPFDDQMYRELQCSINLDEGASFLQLDDEATMGGNFGYSVWETQQVYDKTQVTYVQPAEVSWNGVAHTFQEDHYKQLTTMTGDSKIAVDFNPDTGRWVYGWLFGIMGRLQAQDWSLGTDLPGVTNPNTGSETGPNPPDSPKTVGGHTPATWYGWGDNVTFNINESNSQPYPKHAEISLVWTRHGDASMFAGGEDDPEDTLLAFIDSYVTYIQYADIRCNMLCGYVSAQNVARQTNGTYTSFIEEIQWAIVGKGTGVLDPPYTVNGQGGSIYQSYKPDETPYNSTSHQFMRWAAPPTTVNLGDGGHTRVEMEEWAANLSDNYVGYNYSFTMSHENDDEALWSPYWVDHYPTFFLDGRSVRYAWIPLTIIQMLRDPRCETTAVYGNTELNESLVAIEFFDKTEQSFVSKHYSWADIDGDPITITEGATKITPGGLR